MKDNILNAKIKNYIFVFLSVLLIFINIPIALKVGIIGGDLSSQLVIYPLLIGLFYTAYYQYKEKNILKDSRFFFYYIFIYISIILASLFLGLVYYPYYSQILEEPVNNINHFLQIKHIFNILGISIEDYQLLTFWIIIKPIKKLIFNTLYMFGGAYMVYCWYKNDWGNALKICCLSIVICFLFIFSYSIIELFYLGGSASAEVMLMKINPYIHVIKENSTWWPPLLWPNQLRSVFAEPSYFGIFAAFALPFLWYKLVCSKKYIYFFMITTFSFLLFLTKARTAFMLHLGELFLLIVFTLLYLRNKEYMKRIAVIFICSIMAFITSNLFIANVIDKHEQKISTMQAVTKYVDSNAASLANPDSRSNRARYSLVEADLKIGLEHPLLGVGMGLRNAYMPNYFSNRALENNEIKIWMEFQKKLGILNFGFPMLGEYTSRFAETGILGLICFLVPPFYLLYNIFKKLRFLSMKERLPYIMYVISLLGIMASGIGDTLNITYCYWLLLGLGYAMCFGKKYNDKDAYERT